MSDTLTEVRLWYWSRISAMALSFHLSPWPSLSRALANSATAADSPFEVHQWITSRSVALAAMVPAITAAAASNTLRAFLIIFLPRRCLMRHFVQRSKTGRFTLHYGRFVIDYINPIGAGRHVNRGGRYYSSRHDLHCQ